MFCRRLRFWPMHFLSPPHILNARGARYAAMQGGHPFRCDPRERGAFARQGGGREAVRRRQGGCLRPRRGDGLPGARGRCRLFCRGARRRGGAPAPCGHFRRYPCARAALIHRRSGARRPVRVDRIRRRRAGYRARFPRFGGAGADCPRALAGEHGHESLRL